MRKVKVIKKDEQKKKAQDPARCETALLEILIARNPERAKQFLRRLREAVVT